MSVCLSPGIKIAGGRSALGADFGIFVKKVLSGGAADLDGKHKDSTVIHSVTKLLRHVCLPHHSFYIHSNITVFR